MWRIDTAAVLLVTGSFVFAILSNISILTIIAQRRNHLYQRRFDVDLTAVAKKPDVYEPVEMVDL
jgi:hypothetical protein